jgi:hypothetical protein
MTPVRFTAYVRFWSPQPAEFPRKFNLPEDVKISVRPFAQLFTRAHDSEKNRPSVRIALGKKYGAERIYSDGYQ